MLRRYICSLPNPGTKGVVHEIFYHDDALGHVRAEKFAERENMPGRGVYDCIGILQDNATSRRIETVAALDCIVTDLDLKNIVEPRDEVLNCLHNLTLPPSEIRDSGYGLHAIWRLKEPVSDAEGLIQAETIMKQLVGLLAGDPAPTHRAALLRRPGTDNTKNGGARRCEVIEANDTQYDITEFGTMFDLYGDQSKLKRKQEEKVSAPGSDEEPKGPVDIDARLAAMRYKGPGDGAINITQRDVMAALVARDVSLTEATATVLEATRRCIANDPRAANWDWYEEELDIAWSGARLINKNPQYADRLPEDLRAKFQQLTETGQRPVVRKNKYKLFVSPRYSYSDPPARILELTNIEHRDPPINSDQPPTADKPGIAGQPKRPKPELFVLRSFEPFDPATLPPREWLYGRHYLRQAVSATVAPGGYGKSTLDLVEAIAMATCRNLLGEQPKERLRVWYHNGEDSRDEINRRVAAICQHYDIAQQELVGWLFITSGNEVPLRVAEGYTKLEINAALIARISDQIKQNQIDAAIFDPLITLHGVPETDNTKMDQVIRIFASIADENKCAIELSHHVRKGASGSNGDYGAADIRGATAIHDAIRGARMLNHMSDQDARDLAIEPHHRSQYFRVDRAKGNYSPAAKAVWRQFVNVEIANGDDVGVLVAWDFPGQGAPTPQRQEQDRKADFVFLQLLDRYTLEGRTVSDRSGPNYAPARFAKESEARLANLGNVALAQAMRRLFQDKKIKATDEGTGGKTKHKIVRA